MSWRATRFGKRKVNVQSTNRSTNGRKGSTSHRSGDQQLIVRFLMDENGLENIFGSSSPTYALCVALRIQKAKKRDAEYASLPSPDIHIESRRRLPKRNLHHLTPKCRKNAPFYGNIRSNLLLIKVSRHDALHDEFGVRTWEEIIFVLSRCVMVARQMDFDMMVDRIQGTRRRRACNKRVLRSLRCTQYHIDPGSLRGSFCGL
jgi:hypothetical protein